MMCMQDCADWAKHVQAKLFIQTLGLILSILYFSKQLKFYSKDGLTCGDPELWTHVAMAIEIEDSMTLGNSCNLFIVPVFLTEQPNKIILILTFR